MGESVVGWQMGRDIESVEVASVGELQTLLYEGGPSGVVDDHVVFSHFTDDHFNMFCVDSLQFQFQCAVGGSFKVKKAVSPDLGSTLFNNFLHEPVLLFCLIC